MTFAVSVPDALRHSGPGVHDGRAPLLTLAQRLLGDGHLTVVDIGARGRLLPAFEPIAPLTRMVGFEADTAEAERLRHTNQVGWKGLTVVQGAVAGRTGRRQFHMTRRRDLSSLLRPLPQGNRDWDVEEVRRVDVRSVSDWAADGSFPTECDYLKIDVQGTEYEILASVPAEVWSRLAAVEVECRFGQHYEDQSHFVDVARLLREQGFELAALSPVFRGGSGVDLVDRGLPTRRTLSHGDALFMRPQSWPRDAPAGQDWAAAVLLLAHAVNGFWEQARCLAQRYVPAVLQDVDACLPRREHPLRWRMRVMARVLRLLVRPSRAERFALADLALRVDGPDSRWRLSAPKL